MAIINGRGTVGIRSGVSAGPQLDGDASAFILAANITNPTQQSAIFTLVSSLKSSGVWTKMKAIYPFVGGTAASHKFNLKDPRDLDAAFRLTFTAGWVHSSTGALPNGTSDYANTFLNGTKLTTNNTHLSFYSRTQSLQALNIDMGADKSPNANQILTLSIARSSGNSSAAHTSQALNTSIAIATGQTSSQGLFVNNRNGANATDLKIIRNNTILATASTNGTNNVSNIINIYIAALNNDGVGPNFFSNKETAFASIGDGLSDTEASNLYTAVQTYQTTLGRQVGVPIVSDSDAQSFLNAAVITDTTQASAVNTLVTSLKSYGIWTKMKAIYPFVGGTAASHKFNLKDPRDLDAAFRLTFTAGWVHSSTGALPNGSSDYARTYFNDSNLSINSSQWSIYNRTNTSRANKHDFGYLRNNSNYVSNLLAVNYTTIGTATRTNSYSRADYSLQSNYSGFYNGNRNNSSNFNLFLNGNKVTTTSESTSGKQLSGYEYYMGCLYLDGALSEYSTNQYAFASIGDGLTDTEASNLYTAVQAYQTTLGRQV